MFGKKRQVRDKEKADKIRNAAAKTLAKLERWQELYLWYYEDVQSVFVETSELLAKDFDIIVARDYLWKKLSDARVNAAQRILDEEIEIAYVELYGYYPVIYEKFVRTINKLKEEEERTFKGLIESTQDDVLSFAEFEDKYTSAMLGDALRKSCFNYRKSFQEKIEIILKPIHDRLVHLISESDEEILKKSNLKKDV